MLRRRSLGKKHLQGGKGRQQDRAGGTTDRNVPAQRAAPEHLPIGGVPRCAEIGVLIPPTALLAVAGITREKCDLGLKLMAGGSQSGHPASCSWAVVLSWRGSEQHISASAQRRCQCLWNPSLPRRALSIVTLGCFVESIILPLAWSWPFSAKLGPTQMLSIFSCSHRSFVYLLWRNVYSYPLPIFKLGYLSFYY